MEEAGVLQLVEAGGVTISPIAGGVPALMPEPPNGLFPNPPLKPPKPPPKPPKPPKPPNEPEGVVSTWR